MKAPAEFKRLLREAMRNAGANRRMKPAKGEHSKHARLRPRLLVDADGFTTAGEPIVWHTTKRAPWTKKTEQRAANKRARMSRKANR